MLDYIFINNMNLKHGKGKEFKIFVVMHIINEFYINLNNILKKNSLNSVV